MAKMYEKCPNCKEETEFSYGEETKWECQKCGAMFKDPDLTIRYKFPKFKETVLRRELDKADFDDIDHIVENIDTLIEIINNYKRSD